MAIFTYKAVSASGKEEFGTLEAPNTSTAIDRLFQKNLTPIDVRPKATGLMQKLHEPVQFGKAISDEDIADITLELSRLLKAGLTIERAMAVIIEGRKDSPMGHMLGRVLSRVREGGTLAEAMGQEKEFDDHYINMVRAGELSGALGDVFAKLSEHLERRREFVGKVTSALIYPAILMVLLFVTLIVVVTFVLPQFEEIFSDAGVELPIMTRGVMAFGDLITNWWWLIVGMAIGISVWGRQQLKKSDVREAFERRLIGTRWLGTFLVKYEFVRFLQTMGTMLACGISVDRAMPIAASTVKNTAIRQDLSCALKRVREGVRLKAALGRITYVPPSALQLIMVGEETGELDKMLLEAGDALDRQVQSAIVRALAALVPLVTLVAGGIIALFIGSVLLGILSINDLAI